MPQKEPVRHRKPRSHKALFDFNLRKETVGYSPVPTNIRFDVAEYVLVTV
jgi:hypothetical protein